MSLSVNSVLFGVWNLPVPPVAPSSKELDTFILFVKFVFAVILSALTVPFTSTLPSKTLRMTSVKSAPSASEAVVVAVALYTLVPFIPALLSTSVTLSFGLLVLSAADAITRVAASFARASPSNAVSSHQATTSAALNPEVFASSYSNTPPSRTPFAPVGPVGPVGPVAPSSVLVIVTFEV